MWSDAFAQTAGAPPANPAIATLLMMLQFLPILVIVYFLIIRPQRQRQKETEKMLKAITKGDRVVTSGGIMGTVVGIDDSKAVLRIADQVTVEFTKGSIVQKLGGDAKP